MSKLSPQKAREMLKNPPHGKPLTTKQKHYFGMVAHGINKYQEGGWLDKYMPQVDPEMMYKDKYNTSLTPIEKKEYDKWVAGESKRQGRDILMDLGNYDVQGFWKNDRKIVGGHASDKWKKPNHPTFSNESIYHGVDGSYGGSWGEDGSYYPTRQTRELYDEEYYKRLFGREPERPEHLNLSKSTPYTPSIYADGGEVNYNNSSVSLPKDYVGIGYDTTGRNYSPAWGGQFGDGGNLSGTAEVNKPIRRRKGYFPGFSELADKLFYPLGYPNNVSELIKAIKNKKEWEKYGGLDTKDSGEQAIVDAFKMYLGLPQKYNSYKESKYKPSTSTDKSTVYYSLRNKELVDNMLKEINEGQIKFNGKGIARPSNLPFEHYKLSKGKDEQGDYLSYYDIWDLKPPFLKGKEVSKVYPAGSPFEVYDRVYVKKDENGNYVPTEQFYNGGEIMNVANLKNPIAQDGRTIYYQNGLDWNKVRGMQNGGEVNPYQKLAEYNPLPAEIPKTKEDYGVYGVIPSPMKAYHFEQSYWKAQENTPEEEQIQLIDTRNVPATQRFNPKVGKDTVTNLVEGAKQRGLNPATVLSMALAESNIARVNPLHSGVRDMNSYDTMKYYAEKYPQGISAKTISDESLDLLKEKMDYARRIGKTSEEDIIQGWNGYGTIPADRPMYGMKGPIDMSKNPVYGKRIKELQRGVIEKTPALMDIVAGRQPLASLQDGGELTRLDQLENWTNYNKPTKGGWLNKYNGI